jgi:hypothetical protein
MKLATLPNAAIVELEIRSRAKQKAASISDEAFVD